MFDSSSKSLEPLMQIEIADYVELGRLVVEWAKDPASRPTSVTEFMRQLDGIAIVPRGFKRLAFIQDDGETLYLRLPSATALDAGMAEADDAFAPPDYPLPYFYRDYLDPGFGPVMSMLDTLLARLGDQLAAQPR